MTPQTREMQLLGGAIGIVQKFASCFASSSRQEARFQLLEAVASRLGGFDLVGYHRKFSIANIADYGELLTAARNLVEAVSDLEMSPAIAVSALARETLDESSKRRSGAYHTDFRLAGQIALGLKPHLKQGIRIVDPACGAGILLVALSCAACGVDRQFTSEWLSHSVFAADRSVLALRGTQIALACLTDDLSAISALRRNWRVQDSLLSGPESWGSEAQRFDVVVANPPWEKVKISRHEFIQSEGVARNYGADYSSFDSVKYASRKAEAESYGNLLAQRYEALKKGEPDLYVAFTELLLDLAKPGGQISLILPGGLIRSQNTKLLREHLFTQSSRIRIDVLDNRARFFEIDTRFKFLLVQAKKRMGADRAEPIELGHGIASHSGHPKSRPVHIGRAQLARLRPDFSVPEVRSDAEWKLFVHMSERGVDWSDPSSPWFPHFMREVDMTRDRPSFRSSSAPDTLPVVEGRMVHQHRFGAKSYVSGTGRAALWRSNKLGASEIAPQFWIRQGDLSDTASERSRILRAGFCDITGQTNERSCLASIISPGVSCGNKVPTIVFPNDNSEDRVWLWVALVNSFAFDWLMRRVITTTINYFHLLSVRLPPISPASLPGRQLVSIARELSKLDLAGSNSLTYRKIAQLRARADYLALKAYGLSQPEFDLIIADFPLVDGAQSPLPGELRSTITRDLVFSQWREGERAKISRRRYAEATTQGAYAYLPSQIANVGPVSALEVDYG